MKKKKRNKKAKANWNWKIPAIIGGAIVGVIILLSVIALALGGGFNRGQLQTALVSGGLGDYGHTGRQDAKCGKAKNTCSRGVYERINRTARIALGTVDLYDIWGCQGLEGGKDEICKSLKPGVVDSTGHIKTQCHLDSLRDGNNGYLIKFGKSGKKLISD